MWARPHVVFLLGSPAAVLTNLLLWAVVIYIQAPKSAPQSQGHGSLIRRGRPLTGGA